MVEPRLVLPTLGQFGKKAGHYFESGTKSILESRGAKRYISSVLLVGGLSTIGIMIGEGDPQEHGVGIPQWALLGELLPNIKDVRIHLDVNHIFKVPVFDAETLAGVVSLPKLSSVQVELWICTETEKWGQYLMPELIDKLRSKIESAMQAKAKAMGKVVTIKLVLPTGHDENCYCCMEIWGKAPKDS